MASIGPIENAMQGVQRGMQGLNKAASEIASAGTHQADSPAHVARPMVEMIEHRTQVQVSAKAVRLIDEALGSLLDVKV